MTLAAAIILSAVLSYLLGNINGAVLISYLHSHDDVRLHGSGNAGFTNFFRNYGGGISFIVMGVDLAKAIVGCLISGAILGPFGLHREGMMLGAVCVTLGHNYPALLGFHGGKGILCSFAAAIIIDWRIALAVLAVFMVLYFLTQYVSLASIAAAVAYGLAFVLLYKDMFWIAAGGVFLSLLALFMHRGNLVRLVRGEETKTDFFHREGKK